MPGTVHSSLPVFTSVLYIDRHSHFTEKEVEAWGGEGASWGHSMKSSRAWAHASSGQCRLTIVDDVSTLCLFLCTKRGGGTHSGPWEGHSGKNLLNTSPLWVPVPPEFLLAWQMASASFLLPGLVSDSGLSSVGWALQEERLWTRWLKYC